MKAQYLFALLTAATAVIAAPVPSREVCRPRQQKVVTIVHTAYTHSSSAASAPTTKKEEPIPVPSPTPKEQAPVVVDDEKIPQKEDRVAQKPTTTPAKEPVPSPEPSKTVEKPVEKPVETYTPPPQPSTPVEKPVEQNPPTSGNPTGENRSGWATYYHPSEGLGACGKQHSDDELVVAVSAQVYAEFALTSPGDPNSSAACNTYLKCNWEGKSVRVKIVDKCFACAENNGLNIDLSPAAFKLFGPLTTGKLEGMTWSIDS